LGDPKETTTAWKRRAGKKVRGGANGKKRSRGPAPGFLMTRRPKKTAEGDITKVGREKAQPQKT